MDTVSFVIGCAMLLTLQIIHSVYSVGMFVALGLILRCAWLGRRPAYLKWLLVLVGIELVAIIPLGFVCPIRLIVDQYWGPDTPDQIIPEAVAAWFIELGLGMMGAALLLFAWRSKAIDQ